MNFFRAFGENYMTMLKNWWRTQLTGSLSTSAFLCSFGIYWPNMLDPLLSAVSRWDSYILKSQWWCQMWLQFLWDVLHHTQRPRHISVLPWAKALWLWKPVTTSANFSEQNSSFLTVRTKHDGKELVNQQAYLHVVSHLTLGHPEEFWVGFTGA